MGLNSMPRTARRAVRPAPDLSSVELDSRLIEL